MIIPQSMNLNPNFPYHGSQAWLQGFDYGPSLLLKHFSASSEASSLYQTRFPGIVNIIHFIACAFSTLVLTPKHIKSTLIKWSNLFGLQASAIERS